MMRLTLHDDLPFVSLALTYRGAAVTVAQVLIGILGMDFVTRAGAIVNLRELRLDFAPQRAGVTNALNYSNHDNHV